MINNKRLITSFIFGILTTCGLICILINIFTYNKKIKYNNKSYLESNHTHIADYNNANQRLTDLELNRSSAKNEFSPSSTAGFGGYIDFHYNGSTSDYTSRIIENASGSINLVGSNGVKFNGFDYTKKPVQVFASNTFTSSTTFAYTGVSITIPANSFYSLKFRADYNNARPTEIGVSTSSSTYTEVVSSLVGHHDAIISLNGSTSSATSFYVWATYPSANNNRATIEGFYMPK